MADQGVRGRGDVDRSPLGEEVQRVTAHVEELVELVRYDPPTPGVVVTTRRQLARELRLEPLALRRACSASVDDESRAQIDSCVGRGEDLARAVEDNEDFARVSARIAAHLEDLNRLAEAITETSTANPGQLATQFS